MSRWFCDPGSGSFALVLLMLITVAGCASGAPKAGVQRAEERGSAEEPSGPPPGGDFTLRSPRGPVSLHDFRGKVVLLFFGYASCPDVCPTSLAFLTKTLNSLNEKELAQVQPLFVTLDPTRDDAAKLAEYLRFFHPRFIGLTGTEEEIAEVARLYGVKYYRVEMEGSSDYAINHSAAIYLITQDGTLRFLFPHGTSPALVAKAIRYLLQGSRKERKSSTAGPNDAGSTAEDGVRSRNDHPAPVAP